MPPKAIPGRNVDTYLAELVSSLSFAGADDADYAGIDNALPDLIQYFGSTGHNAVYNALRNKYKSTVSDWLSVWYDKLQDVESKIFQMKQKTDGKRYKAIPNEEKTETVKNILAEYFPLSDLRIPDGMQDNYMVQKIEALKSAAKLLLGSKARLLAALTLINKYLV